jgi:hypothetical protein
VWHVALFPEQIAATIALLGEEGEPATPFMDGELLNHIRDTTSQINPLEWPKNYKLNDKLVLV